MADIEKRSTLCGTRDYLAPEVAAKKNYDEKVDIWCFGVLIYELIHKKTPFEIKDVYLMGVTNK